MVIERYLGLCRGFQGLGFTNVRPKIRAIVFGGLYRVSLFKEITNKVSGLGQFKGLLHVGEKSV